MVPKNKKSSKTSLTAKKRKQGVLAGKECVSLLDAMHERCERLGAVGGLLAACGQGEPVDCKLARDTGTLIGGEVEQLQTLLSSLEEHLRSR
jgi:hypothetical protein